MPSDDSGLDSPAARRRRRRGTAPQGAPRVDVTRADVAAEPITPQATASEPTVQRRDDQHRSPRTAQRPAQTQQPTRGPRPAREGVERGLRDIVGGGSSQLGVSGAMRARDVDRPTAEDLAAAERDLVIVRRNWKPPKD
jgi:hypothetical protein